MKAVAAFLALLVSFQCAAGYTGFIRTSNEKFVDDNCQEFVPLGMNTYGCSAMQTAAVSARACLYAYLAATVRQTVLASAAKCMSLMLIQLYER